MVVDGRLYDQITVVCDKKQTRRKTQPAYRCQRASLSLVVAAASMHDIELVADTLDALQTGRPGQKLRLVAGHVPAPTYYICVMSNIQGRNGLFRLCCRTLPQKPSQSASRAFSASEYLPQYAGSQTRTGRPALSPVSRPPVHFSRSRGAFTSRATC